MMSFWGVLGHDFGCSRLGRSTAESGGVHGFEIVYIVLGSFEPCRSVGVLPEY